MDVEICGNYAGELLKIFFKDETKQKMGGIIKINGFIETNSLRIQYLTTIPKYIKGTAELLLPKNIIPSYKYHSARVWYECVLILSPEEVEIFSIEIFNNNLELFSTATPVVLEFGAPDNQEYYEKKDVLSSLILESDGDQLSGSLANSNLSFFHVKPVFETPNCLEITQVTKITAIKDGKERIATLEIPSVLLKKSSIQISYAKNILRTELLLYREYYENSQLMDRKAISHLKIETDGCKSTMMDIETDGETMRNDLFSVEYSLIIYLDDVQATAKLDILMKESKIVML